MRPEEVGWVGREEGFVGSAESLVGLFFVVWSPSEQCRVYDRAMTLSC